MTSLACSVVELEQNQQGAEIPDFIVHGCLMLDLLGGAYVVKRSYFQVNLDFVGASTPLLCVSSALELGNVFINLSGGHCLVQYVRN
jgi:hypothetical protein